jgi:hypothetical protein
MGCGIIFFVGNATGVTINGLKLHNFQYSAILSGGGNDTWTATNYCLQWVLRCGLGRLFIKR